MIEPMVDVPGFPAHSPSFAPDPMTTAEVERLEALHEPLIRAVRELVEEAMSTTAAVSSVQQAQADVEGVVSRLRARQIPGPFGIRFNEEGRSWSWGNAVIGVRNALATPLVTHHDEGAGDDDRSNLHWAETELGARHAGDVPGQAHPGVPGLLLDHLMGETASGFRKVTMTGTLSVTSLRPTPIGPVRLEAWVTSDEGRKVTVDAHLFELTDDRTLPAEGACTTATGLFIVPRWAL